MSKKEIRKNFKESVFKRDGYSCVWCHAKYEKSRVDECLDSHHITDRNAMPNGGYVKENGISLCKNPSGTIVLNGEDGLLEEFIDPISCHMKAERFHITKGKEWEPGMHPDDLYKIIGSSFEKATEASFKIK